MVSFKTTVYIFCSLFMAVLASPTNSYLTAVTSSKTTTAAPYVQTYDPWYLNVTDGILEYPMGVFIMRFGPGDERNLPGPVKPNAAEYGFWIGKDTAVMPCPYQDDEVCGTGNETVVVHDPVTATLWLYTNDPLGDQQIYIDNSGRLAYKPNRSPVGFPPSSITDGFKLYRGGYGQYLLGNLKSRSGWAVCPIVKDVGPWQVFAEITEQEKIPTGNSSDCVFINMSFDRAQPDPQVWGYN
ncbi:hypothetical protein AA313_de0201029 [Arthrobotrys entomopaga]|nr:hypothetical protein AA313_de0201029 [Arthrobotrys entomopaga]